MAPPEYMAMLFENYESITYNSILLINKQTPKLAVFRKHV